MSLSIKNLQKKKSDHCPPYKIKNTIIIITHLTNMKTNKIGSMASRHFYISHAQVVQKFVTWSLQLLRTNCVVGRTQYVHSVRRYQRLMFAAWNWMLCVIKLRGLFNFVSQHLSEDACLHCRLIVHILYSDTCRHGRYIYIYIIIWRSL